MMKCIMFGPMSINYYYYYYTLFGQCGLSTYYTLWYNSHSATPEGAKRVRHLAIICILPLGGSTIDGSDSQRKHRLPVSE